MPSSHSRDNELQPAGVLQLAGERQTQQGAQAFSRCHGCHLTLWGWSVVGLKVTSARSLPAFFCESLNS